MALYFQSLMATQQHLADDRNGPCSRLSRWPAACSRSSSIHCGSPQVLELPNFLFLLYIPTTPFGPLLHLSLFFSVTSLWAPNLSAQERLLTMTQKKCLWECNDTFINGNTQIWHSLFGVDFWLINFYQMHSLSWWHLDQKKFIQNNCGWTSP